MKQSAKINPHKSHSQLIFNKECQPLISLTKDESMSRFVKITTTRIKSTLETCYQTLLISRRTTMVVLVNVGLSILYIRHLIPLNKEA